MRTISLAGKKLFTMKPHIKHQCVHTEKRYRCFCCNQYFYVRASLNRHLNLMHSAVDVDLLPNQSCRCRTTDQLWKQAPRFHQNIHQPVFTNNVRVTLSMNGIHMNKDVQYRPRRISRHSEVGEDANPMFDQSYSHSAPTSKPASHGHSHGLARSSEVQRNSLHGCTHYENNSSAKQSMDIKTVQPSRSTRAKSGLIHWKKRMI